MTGVVDPKAEAHARARHAEVEAAFLRSRELSGAEREAALEGLDAGLRREVEELLAAAERDDDALSDRRIDGREPLAPWIATPAEAEEPSSVPRCGASTSWRRGPAARSPRRGSPSAPS